MLEIYVPMVLVGAEFQVDQLCEHVVVKRPGLPLRWYLIKAQSQGRYPPLKKRGGYLTFTKISDARRMEKALGPFPVSSFRMYVTARLERIAGQQEQVIVLEMQEGLEQVFGQRRSGPADDGPVATPLAPVAPVAPPPVAPIPAEAHGEETEAADAATEQEVDVEQPEELDEEESV